MLPLSLDAEDRGSAAQHRAAHLVRVNSRTEQRKEECVFKGILDGF